MDNSADRAVPLSVVLLLCATRSPLGHNEFVLQIGIVIDPT